MPAILLLAPHLFGRCGVSVRMLLFFFAVHLTLSQHGIGPILELIFKHKSLSSKFSTTWYFSYTYENMYAVFQNSDLGCWTTMCHYKPRLVYVLPHFSLRFIL